MTLRRFGQVIKDHRTRCGITVRYICDECGISENTYYNWVNGITKPTKSNFINICYLLEIKNVDYTLLGEGL